MLSQSIQRESDSVIQFYKQYQNGVYLEIRRKHLSLFYGIVLKRGQKIGRPGRQNPKNRSSFLFLLPEERAFTRGAQGERGDGGREAEGGKRSLGGVFVARSRGKEGLVRGAQKSEVRTAEAAVMTTAGAGSRIMYRNSA